MIGLDIRVKNEYGNYLYKIFNGIDFSKYVWVINSDDIIYPENSDINQGLFGSDVLSGSDFFNCISKESYYLIFVDIKAYPVGSDRIEIKTFEDFSKSNCEMVLLCTDSTFVEFYSKDRTSLDKVYSNCIKNDFDKVEYKFIEDVSGRVFIAW